MQQTINGRTEDEIRGVATGLAFLRAVYHIVESGHFSTPQQVWLSNLLAAAMADTRPGIAERGKEYSEHLQLQRTPETYPR